MKRISTAAAVVLTILAVLVIGLVLVVTVSPVRAQIGEAISRVLEGQPVMAAALQPQATPQLTLKDEKGILVGGVFTGSPADKAGIVRGDILLQVDGQAVNTNADLHGILAKHKEGDTLSLLIQHGDQQKTVSVTLASPLAPAATTAQATPQATPQGGPNNAPQKRSWFQSVPFLGIIPIGVNEGFGLGNNAQSFGRITQVASGSPAEQAGLKVGEVITAVDGAAVDAQNSLSSLIAKHKPGDAVKLSVTGTDGASREVTVTLGDNPQSAGKAYLGVTVMGPRGRFFRGFPNFAMPGLPGNPNNNNGQQNGRPFNRGINPGLAGHQGALIDQVTSGSPAEKAGLKSGQLITSVDGKAVNSQTALSDAISSHKPGDVVTLSVFDPQTNQSSDVKVTLGDNPQKSGSPWLGISYGYINPQPRQNQAGTTF